eukprot:scaffold305734_cov32-Tisochrysis_lutea.AAC.1
MRILHPAHGGARFVTVRHNSKLLVVGYQSINSHESDELPLLRSTCAWQMRIRQSCPNAGEGRIPPCLGERDYYTTE